MLHKSDGVERPPAGGRLRFCWFRRDADTHASNAPDICLHMIFSENRFPLFGIMLWGFAPSRQAFLRTLFGMA
jgi:hypothetical protein